MIANGRHGRNAAAQVNRRGSPLLGHCRHSRFHDAAMDTSKFGERSQEIWTGAPDPLPPVERRRTGRSWTWLNGKTHALRRDSDSGRERALVPHAAFALVYHGSGIQQQDRGRPHGRLR